MLKKQKKPKKPNNNKTKHAIVIHFSPILQNNRSIVSLHCSPYRAFFKNLYWGIRLNLAQSGERQSDLRNK